ncbi:MULTISPECIES: TetM/TetW/TetO/TetS family tetracycline resistance ribosomal protection protein [unclassified Streptomyces]|uniref:elongation factor G n=1 Tax=unclassified Streptomyces TaxID=2593676 RepID=UPI0023652183|nr:MULTISPECIES: TetM/TetW/TetO/TetS family tetracycline resistance ribosomal protection protein [unclassified Streptomyces]MDF3145517.1 TetM/TetW/TetO/TetS family tetracycline resistance ribosomal protection protein [Streptomyces sp. T21Q-yed]WDF35531.1 TetM/TetW/TetO/TetS family tetracycline resistance ribosomal protection protein [Streptomyces sp. T12]
MHLLNLGILAHVDAGKTSLTERLLHTAGVIDEIGSVDAGNTQADSLALERQRGITIKSAVVSFALDDVTVNLIDTPGHPDFIAEVERVLGVLDGAVLVVSAVEGVQPQTRVLMRTLQRLRIPTLVFVNKIDRRGARYDAVLRAISQRLTAAVVPMGTAAALGTRDARFLPGLGPSALDVLADLDDDLLTAYVEDTVSHDRLHAALADRTRQAFVHPVYFGSAVTGAGVDALIGGIRELLPAAGGDPDGPVSGTVFKVERGPAGEKVAYARMFSGTLHTRDRIRFGAPGESSDAGGLADLRTEGRITAVSVFDHGADVRDDLVAAGRIAKLWGLGDIRIGDALGEPRKTHGHFFAPPTLETVVVPGDGADRRALHRALTLLAEQDPLIDLRHDEVRQETFVSLYGEVQKEVIQATLADEFGLDVTFRETTPLCVERPVGSGAAVEFNKKDGNPFLATVGLRVDPAPVGSGVAFRLEVELGSMPYAFFKAVEDTVRETLGQGLRGWQIPDCTVTMTHSGYSPRQSHAHQGFDKSMSSTGYDFRGLTPLVLTEALRRAGTQVHEPMHRFRIEAPADTLAALLPVLTRLRAVPQSTQTRGTCCSLEGSVPAAHVHELEQQLPGLTRGEGELESTFDHYAPAARGTVPERRRTDLNPLNRKEYLLNLTRRVGG